MQKTATKLELPIILTLLAVLALSGPAADSCQGSDTAASTPVINLDARNEPLGSVLGKISKTTRWKIKAPDKWMEKPVSQTLNKAPLEDGLKSVLRNAGIENILLMYDENARVINIFDTEGPQKQAAERPQAPVRAQTPAVSPANETPPVIKSPERTVTPGKSSGSRRARRQSRSEDD